MLPRDPTPRPDFVGRTRELTLLLAALETARAGRGSLFLVKGEPGIGKTRLADEVAVRASEAGVLVCWGRCWEGGGAPGYWPWIQVLRTCARAIDAAGREAATSLLTRLVPDPTPTIADPLTLESPYARFALFDAVATFVAEVTRARPLLVVLDDIHAADRASLLLLQFIARTLPESAMMLVVTHREAEVQADPERARLLDDIVRDGAELVVRGLDAAESASLIAVIGGARPAPALATSLHEMTGGNPFFLNELTRLMVDGDPRGWPDGRAPLALPERVRGVVRRRLDALPAETLAVLEVGSVVGQEFDLRVVGHVLALPSEDVCARLEVAGVGGIVRAVSERSERRRFAHALVREVLYDDLEPTRRASVHRTVAEALETLRAGRLETVLPALARHFRLAGATARASDYAERAGRQALAQIAYEDAVVHLERAVKLLEATGSTDDRRRVTLLQALGDARRRTGDVDAGRRTLHEAAILARGVGDAHLFARVVLAFGWSFELGRPEEDRIALLEEAARALRDESSALRARVLGTLAVALYWNPAARDRMLRSSEDAVDLARRVGDASTLGHVLHCRRWVLGIELSPRDSLAATSEVLGLAEQVGDRELVLQCRRWRVADLLTVGEVDAAWREIERHDALANQLRLPLYRWYSASWKAMRALLEGRFADAERDAAEAHRIGVRAEPSNAEATYVGHMAYVRLQQGRVDDFLPAVRVLAREGTPAPGFRVGLIGLLTEAGVEAEARPLFDELARAGFPLPSDKSTLYTLASLADSCALLGDAARAETLYARLEPWQGRVIAIEPAFLVGGAVDRCRAVLAATMRRWTDAEQHFEDALALNARLGARPWSARTQQEFASMLAARDAASDRLRARALAEEALATAVELGMTGIAARAEDVLARLGDVDGVVPQAAPAPESAYLRAEGEYWTIAYRDQAVRLRATAGLRYLARLLRNPGTGLHALDLVTGADGREPNGLDRGDAGPVLDPQARAAYRARLADLDAELAEAESANDLGWQHRARAEREALVGQLAAAVGLAGRERRVGSAAERARLNVTRAIKSALARIAGVHPDLGAHLARTVRTGTYCSYQPDPRAPIAWGE